MKLEVVREGVDYEIEVVRRLGVFINGELLSNEAGVERLVELGVLYRIVRGDGRRFCTSCRLAYPVGVWKDIYRCPFCNRLLRLRPRKRKGGKTVERVEVFDEG
jgi:hypothetical protein